LWPANDEALNNLGNLLAMQGRFDDALASFQKATEADPRNASRLLQRLAGPYAIVRLQRGQRRGGARVGTRLRDGEDLPGPLGRERGSSAGRSMDRPQAFWQTCSDTPSTEVIPALPVAWRDDRDLGLAVRDRDSHGSPCSHSALGLWWQAKMPLRACSNCTRPVCRRCAQRLREVALCPDCSAIAARAESGEFGRVLLVRRRRQVERRRAMRAHDRRGLVPGLGLLARRRVFGALILLAASVHVVSRWLDLQAPFALGVQLGHGVGGLSWGLSATALVVYVLSVIGYVASPDPDAVAVRVSAPRPNSIAESPASRAA
jgi:hypothetical protein